MDRIMARQQGRRERKDSSIVVRLDDHCLSIVSTQLLLASHLYMLVKAYRLSFHRSFMSMR